MLSVCSMCNHCKVSMDLESETVSRECQLRREPNSISSCSNYIPKTLEIDTSCIINPAVLDIYVRSGVHQ